MQPTKVLQYDFSFLCEETCRAGPQRMHASVYFKSSPSIKKIVLVLSICKVFSCTMRHTIYHCHGEHGHNEAQAAGEAVCILICTRPLYQSPMLQARLRPLPSQPHIAQWKKTVHRTENSKLVGWEQVVVETGTPTSCTALVIQVQATTNSTYKREQQRLLRYCYLPKSENF